MPRCVSYETIIRKEAIDFINEHREMLIEGIKDEADFDRNDIRDLDTSWHENITDRSYDTAAAQWIIDNSDDVESDSGLWDGQDPNEAIQAQAAYTFSNNVWSVASDIYDEIKGEVESALEDVTIEDSPDDVEHEGGIKRRFFENEGDEISLDGVFDADENFVGLLVNVGETSTRVAADVDLSADLPAEVRAVARSILEERGEASDDDMKLAFVTVVANREINDYVRENSPAPIKPGSDEEKRALREWLRMGRNSARSGYPLGGSYIDTRSGALYGTDEHAYVWTDNQLGRQLPHLSGKYKNDVKAYFEETFGGPKPTNASEMLAKIEEMIREGADGDELYDLLPQIRAIREAEADNTPSPGL